MQKLLPDDSGSADGTACLADIVARVFRSDLIAFGLLYESYEHAVERYLHARVNDRETAADLRQETFIQLLHHVSRGHDKLEATVEHFERLLFHIAKNLVIDHCRRASRFKHVSLPSNEPDEPHAYALFADLYEDSHEDIVIEFVCLNEAITKLSTEYRHCISAYSKGYSLREIATARNIHEKSVSSNVSRARRRLADNCSDDRKIGEIPPTTWFIQRWAIISPICLPLAA